MVKKEIGRPGNKSSRKASGRNSAKGRRKKKKEKKEKEESEPQPISPLVYNSQVALEELLVKHQRSPVDEGIGSVRAELAEYQARRTKGQQITVRMGLSRKISRFVLPMDMKELENLTALEYLRRYCFVCSRRQNYYNKSFDKFDRDRDGILSLKEMERALKDVYTDDIASEKVQELAELVRAVSETQFDRQLFGAMCALSERLFYTSFVTEDTEDAGNGARHRVEEADFCSLTSRFRGCDIQGNVKSLLSML
ncbi:hypothetical protein AOXY_G23155 [Acipenser oxyrinchus oxyrinchus]|uniref:EF-hand domain-containing protein n=1 Tax=Acipenser oxyrinchus oxyrinchus TaxID=40147 RepID=A0AAD8CUT2_ACIOX|nr:hypothetical protein AOXY_G23155 [Acipenser oxyrinchus oxyrinchus]